MRHSLFLSAVIFVLMLCGCKNSPDILLKINFQESQLPDTVAEISGFSGQENWGRWTDADVAPTAKVVFKSPLPRHFSLIIKGQSFQGHEQAKIRIGTFEQNFVIKKFGSIADVSVDLSAPENTIEIIPANTSSPRDLGVNNDSRKLGIGLMELSIANAKQ